MPTNTYLPIATITLTGNDSNVTFSNIPQTYKDLVLITNMLASEVNEGYLLLNGSSSGFYSLRMIASSGGLSSATSSTNNLIPTQTGPGAYILQFMDYSASDKHKPILISADRPNDSVTTRYAAKWASNSAITSISILPTSPFVLVPGFTASLYGIAG